MENQRVPELSGRPHIAAGNKRNLEWRQGNSLQVRERAITKPHTQEHTKGDGVNVEEQELLEN